MLWGYMDGGADLYFEYGFVKLCVQEIKFADEKFTVRIFEMSDSEAAFGIWSVNHSKCDSSDIFNNFLCRTKYQVQFAKGRYYISVISESGSRKAQVSGYLVARTLNEKIKEKEFKIPKEFVSDELSLYTINLKFIKGELGLKNGYPDWEEFFDKDEKFKIFILQLPDTCPVILSSLILTGKHYDLQKLYSSYGFEIQKGQDNYYLLKNGRHYYLSVCPCGEIRLFIRNKEL
jgi:hypothetical protein